MRSSSEPKLIPESLNVYELRLSMPTHHRGDYGWQTFTVDELRHRVAEDRCAKQTYTDAYRQLDKDHPVFDAQAEKRVQAWFISAVKRDPWEPGTTLIGIVRLETYRQVRTELRRVRPDLCRKFERYFTRVARDAERRYASRTRCRETLGSRRRSSVRVGYDLQSNLRLSTLRFSARRLRYRVSSPLTLTRNANGQLGHRLPSDPHFEREVARAALIAFCHLYGDDWPELCDQLGVDRTVPAASSVVRKPAPRHRRPPHPRFTVLDHVKAYVWLAVCGWASCLYSGRIALHNDFLVVPNARWAHGAVYAYEYQPPTRDRAGEWVASHDQPVWSDPQSTTAALSRSRAFRSVSGSRASVGGARGSRTVTMSARSDSSARFEADKAEQKRRIHERRPGCAVVTLLGDKSHFDRQTGTIQHADPGKPNQDTSVTLSFDRHGPEEALRYVNALHAEAWHDSPLQNAYNQHWLQYGKRPKVILRCYNHPALFSHNVQAAVQREVMVRLSQDPTMRIVHSEAPTQPRQMSMSRWDIENNVTWFKRNTVCEPERCVRSFRRLYRPDKERTPIVYAGELFPSIQYASKVTGVPPAQLVAQAASSDCPWATWDIVSGTRKAYELIQPDYDLAQPLVVIQGDRSTSTYTDLRKRGRLLGYSFPNVTDGATFESARLVITMDTVRPDRQDTLPRIARTNSLENLFGDGNYALEVHEE